MNDIDSVLELVDRFIAPGEMSKDDALVWLEELAEQVNIRVEALREELKM